MKNLDKPKAGIFHLDVDGSIVAFDEDVEDLVSSLCISDEFRVWNQKRRSLKGPESSPMRAVQFKDCDWSNLYFVDGIRAARFRDMFSNEEYMLDFSLSPSNGGAMICLDICDTADVYSLREYRMGEVEKCLSTHRRQFRGTPFEKICERATVEDIDARLKELNFVYTSVEDPGRTPGGAILPFNEAELYHQYVRKQYLLV